MRHVFLPSIVVIVAAGTWFALAADGDAAKSKPAAKEKKKVDPHRLPAPWGRLELSGEQKDKIYAAQKAARVKLDPIDDELGKLREKLQAKQAERKAVQEELRTRMLAVLSDVQRAQLTELEAKAKARAEARKAEQSGAKGPAARPAESETPQEDS